MQNLLITNLPIQGSLWPGLEMTAIATWFTRSAHLKMKDKYIFYLSWTMDNVEIVTIFCILYKVGEPKPQ